MRVYEFAKELDMSTKDFVEKINSLGYQKTNFSTLSEEEIVDIKSKLNKEKIANKSNKNEVEVIEKKIFDSRKPKFKNEKNNDRNNNGERKPFNKNFRDNRENRENNKEKTGDKKFNKDQNNKRSFEKRNNDKEQVDFKKDNKKPFDKKNKKVLPNKDNKEVNLEIPTVENETKTKNKVKSKFNKKKYENEKS